MKDTLDPFRVLLGALASQKESDLIVAASNLAGLKVDLSLSEKDAATNVQRIRALQPRILQAYDALEDQAKLIAAQAAITNLGPQANHLFDRIQTALANIGWVIQDGHLTPVDPSLREMFFPKGSQWDAFVVLRAVFQQARQSITIVDAYADGTVFQLLAAGPAVAPLVQILCSKHAAAVAAEAKKFAAQYPGVSIEVRSARNEFHDRFVIVDQNDCVHVGASIKDAGNTAFMISKVEDETNRSVLIAAVSAAWANGTVVT